MNQRIKSWANDELSRFIPKRSRFFLQALIPLATTAYGAYSASQQAKKNAKNVVKPEMIDERNPQRKQIDQFLADYVTKFGPSYTPGKEYGGNYTAPMSMFERRGIEEFLPEYLNSGLSTQTGDIRDLLNKTITGKFDPGSSEYYRAFRDEAMRNRDAAVGDTNIDLGARGKFFSSEALDKYADINEGTRVGLNKVMAELAGKERDRSMAAVPYASALEDYISEIPLQKSKAATSIGSLPRLLEQNDLESLYQDFQRRQKEGAAVIGAGSGVSSATVEEGYRLPNLQAPTASDPSQYLQKLMAQMLPQLLSSFGGAK